MKSYSRYERLKPLEYDGLSVCEPINRGRRGLSEFINYSNLEFRYYPALLGPVAESYSNRQSHVRACAVVSKRSRNLHMLPYELVPRSD